LSEDSARNVPEWELLVVHPGIFAKSVEAIEKESFEKYLRPTENGRVRKLLKEKLVAGAQLWTRREE
jgi:hypothetical protein